jgi:class 3 adenylate cyclase
MFERFTGDGMTIFFNDPVLVDDAPERAIRMAGAMRAPGGRTDRPVARARL